jgi:hypothetical protein
MEEKEKRWKIKRAKSKVREAGRRVQARGQLEKVALAPKDVRS